jgi:choline/glycine/proline betaine transport protein
MRNRLERLRSLTTFNTWITIPGLLIIAAVVIGCACFPATTGAYLDAAKQWITTSWGWLFILGVSFFVIFLLVLCVSNLGSIRLGNDDEEPEYPFFSWIAMLFAAGMGIGLMYFGVAEPISHYAMPLHEGLSANAQAKTAMLNTFFHWGIHAWAIYGVLGLALAYFGFRYHVPLTVRSAFYPLLRDKVNGPIGIFIDVVALSCTIFGITTTLGYGSMQLASGFKEVGLISEAHMGTLICIIIVFMTCAILSAISGVSKGVRCLSEINLGLALFLMLFVLAVGPTIIILNDFTENLGAYLSNIIPLSFRTFAYDPQNEGWFTSWTVVYWAWWISWAPFVGMFIAKISRGRTVREFILGVLLVPTVFNLLWMTVFGNTAIWADQVNGGTLSAMASQTEALLFTFLNYLPFSKITSIMSIVIITLFFVTSADSGIFVINGIASSGGIKFPKWQSAFWGIVLAALAILLLYTGGLGALQATTMVMSLPFLVILIVLCFCLLKGLVIDEDYFGRGLSACTSYWTGSFWKDRLNSMFSHPDLNNAKQFIQETAVPAFEELSEEIKKYGVEAKVHYDVMGPLPRAEFVIEQPSMRNFIYGIQCERNAVSEFAANNDSMPQIDDNIIYIPMSYFADGRIGYPVRYMKKDELIIDVLRQYDRFTKLAADKKHLLFLYEPED